MFSADFISGSRDFTQHLTSGVLILIHSADDGRWVHLSQEKNEIITSPGEGTLEVAEEETVAETVTGTLTNMLLDLNWFKLTLSITSEKRKAEIASNCISIGSGLTRSVTM